MDFYVIKERSLTKKGDDVEIYPDFIVGRSEDLMVRGSAFYAIWDEEIGLWSTDEYRVQQLVDKELYAHKKLAKSLTDKRLVVRNMRNFSSNSWLMFKKYLRQLADNAVQLDQRITFANTQVGKKDYVSKKLPYSLEPGDISAYDELMRTLYEPEERQKLEWAIGAVITGDAKSIQKFIVLYGDAGSGKSTVLNIIQELFSGYHTIFDAKDLTTSSKSFATEVFRNNPLVAIQHDGDLSKIEDNTRLNSIVSHEEVIINEKFKSSYALRMNSFLFMATNQPVKITDAKSGLIRRLIDVSPSGRLVPVARYGVLMDQIKFELGAIAHHCLEVYTEMGKNYYAKYRPIGMMFRTDIFLNYVETNFYLFKEQDGVSLKQAYALYKEYCEESSISKILPMYVFREELKNYFKEFHPVTRVDGKQTRSYYRFFLDDKFRFKPLGEDEEDSQPLPLVMDSTESVFDKVYANQPAQYAGSSGTPIYKWDETLTTLSEIDTTQLHYVRPPLNHIVIDFDIVNDAGEKDYELNLRAASKWPKTYSELSRSGHGIHLHYIYEGDVSELSSIYDEDIEIKTFTGKSALRRKLTYCNNLEIATINSGLPLKRKGDQMLNFDSVQSERSLRNLILRNLKKEIHPGTKPSIDFIYKILGDAYNAGLHYDVTDLRPKILAFANNSTNQAQYCVKLVGEMQFKSEEPSPSSKDDIYEVDKLVFFDVEVYPNLFVIVWKMEGKEPVKMINPTPQDVEELLKLKLVGFNNRRYDNHILYARYMGYTNAELSKLSQRIINKSRNAMFSEAYGLSYTDIYDFASKKQSLKRWELELGIPHKEVGHPWDQDLAEKYWDEVADYCVNDVRATEAVFYARQQDFVARQILADLSGLTVNDTTQRHTAEIIFGKDPRPQDKFVYTDLTEMFPGYVFDAGKSTYKGFTTGEGGFVYAEPGMYENVAVLDIESMHPTSLILLDLFGPYTKNFEDLVKARLAIKHQKYDLAKTYLGGILGKYLETKEQAADLSYALKIIINIVYGLTAASFQNKFKDPRNVDNIVAKRGALFMIDLLKAVQALGYPVIHIKTDSIKIPNADNDIIKFVQDFGKQYGYNFEHEATYDKIALVNNAVYIAKTKAGDWDAVGAQFAHPYVYKTLFTREPLEVKDLIEIKSVTTALYLDMNETLLKDEHDYRFIGKTGAFYPIKAGKGGGVLLREKEGKYYAATGSKGYRWLEAEAVLQLNKEEDIDYSYYRGLADDAIKEISTFGNFDWFVSEDPYIETTLLERSK